MKPRTRLPELHIGPVNAEKMKIFAAILRDPNPIHWDRAELRVRGLGDRLINQGPINLGYITNMLAAAFGGHDRIRRLTLRFDANVFEADELIAGGRVTEVKESPDERLATCEVWLDRSDGVRAVSGTAVVVTDGSG